MRAVSTTSLSVLLAMTLMVSMMVVAAAPARAASPSAQAVLDSLVVAADITSPAYNRDFFKHWTDADGDGCNTRAEVLKRDTLVPVTYSSGCTVATGEWYSKFDGATWTVASDVDIDHMVPLSEAWRSGAATWTDKEREEFANDLGFDGSLIVMTDNENQSKGDRDPARWMPDLTSTHCDYMVQWVQVKYRWGLAVDPAEHAFLEDELVGNCGNPSVTLPAKVITSAPGSNDDFSDVSGTHPFADEIQWLANSGVTTGYNDGTFRPSAPVTRQAFAAYLYRYSGAESSTCAGNRFSDVGPSHPFCAEIEWLAATGIATGYKDGSFGAGSPVTRQAMAAFLQRYREAEAATPGVSCNSAAFPDVPQSSPFCGEIRWLSNTGITTGYKDGNFKPGAAITRQAMAAFLFRFDASFGPSDPPLVASPPSGSEAPALVRKGGEVHTQGVRVEEVVGS